MKRDGANLSIWQKDMPSYTPVISGNDLKTFDVIIVGGGITGITTACMLQTSGMNCMVAEAQNLAFGTTSGTTAHLNTILDYTWSELEKKIGEENNRLLLKAVMEAIEIAKTNVEKFNIDCDFETKKGYLYATDEKQKKELDNALQASQKAGCSVTTVDRITVPVPFKKALVYDHQAQMHPVKYVYGLAKAFEKAGGIIMQNCRVTSVDEQPDKLLTVQTSKGEFFAHKLVYATHISPGVNILHFRCAPYRSYVIAARLEGDYPTDPAYDMEEPYHYYRTQMIDGRPYLVAGGEDHRTAEVTDTNAQFENLENYVRKFFNIEEIAFRWSSQYFESADALPYIGHLPGNPEGVFVATGYGGNGITYSQIASKVLRDLIMTGESEYEKLFSPARVKPVAGFSNFVKNAADVAGNFISQLLPTDKIDAPGDLMNDEARVVKYGDHSIALYKDEVGLLHSVSPLCTHMNCSVSWNNSEKMWECPCHGSRFTADGEMVTAPARKDLEKVVLRHEK